VSGALVPGAAAELQHACREYEAFKPGAQGLSGGGRVKSV